MCPPLSKKIKDRTEEMAQRLGARVLAKDLSSIPGTRMAGHNLA